MMMLLLAAVLQASVPVRTIDKGMNSTVDNGRQVVVRTPAEWERLWAEHKGGRARPEVDFSKEMVVAVFLGSRPTAGFSVEIVGARDEGGTLVVSYRETRPSAGGVAAQVLTSPYHIVAVPKHGEVRFEKVD